MDTFDSAETSQARSRPIILYTITTSSTIYRHTTSAMNVDFGGQTFTALTIAHDDEPMTQDASGDDLIIQLPISHPLVQRYAASGVPDQYVQVLIQELQPSAGEVRMSWSGPGQSLSCGLHTAELRVPTIINDAVRIKLPVVVAQKICNHVLFDKGCSPIPGGVGGGPDANAFTITGTLSDVSADGMSLTFVFLGGLPGGWFDFGKLTGTIFDSSFVGENQTRRILSHGGASALTVVIDIPFIASVDQIMATVWSLQAGCDHLITGDCVSKFNNRVNFGGHPDIDATINLWAGKGLGVIQQS